MRLLFTFAFSKMMRAFKQDFHSRLLKRACKMLSKALINLYKPIDQEDLPSSVMLLKRNLKKLLKECTASQRTYSQVYSVDMPSPPLLIGKHELIRYSCLGFHG
ncbi:hypothetical protein SDJN03_20376, partial [Cucurbita argyrosperma subsp. sororia]